VEVNKCKREGIERVMEKQRPNQKLTGRKKEKGNRKGAWNEVTSEGGGIPGVGIPLHLTSGRKYLRLGWS